MKFKFCNKLYLSTFFCFLHYSCRMCFRWTNLSTLTIALYSILFIIPLLLLVVLLLSYFYYIQIDDFLLFKISFFLTLLLSFGKFLIFYLKAKIFQNFQFLYKNLKIIQFYFTSIKSLTFVFFFFFFGGFSKQTSESDSSTTGLIASFLLSPVILSFFFLTFVDSDWVSPASLTISFSDSIRMDSILTFSLRVLLYRSVIQ